MHHSNNALKTAALLGLLSAILIIGGRAIAGDRGIEYGLVIAVVMNFASYFFSDKIALATSGAQPVTQESAPEIYARVAPLVGRLAQRMNIPMPKLYITPEPSPNAFATGRNPNNASVAFTQGILQLMDDSELEGVVAHELGHVLNRDILISSIAGTIAAAITVLSRFALFFGGGGSRDERNRGGGLETLVMLIVGPIAAMMVQMAISRTREFSADAASAKYIGSPYTDRSPAQARRLVASHPHGSDPDHPAPLHHETARGRLHDAPLLHSPEHRGTDQEVRANALVFAGGAGWHPARDCESRQLIPNSNPHSITNRR
jgi:heat shock protein HtpX